MGALFSSSSCDYSEHVPKINADSELSLLESELSSCLTESNKECDYTTELSNYIEKDKLRNMYKSKTKCLSEVQYCESGGTAFDNKLLKYPIMFIPELSMATMGKPCNHVQCPQGTSKRSISFLDLEANVRSCCVVPSTCETFLSGRTCNELDSVKTIPSSKSRIEPLRFNDANIETVEKYLIDTCCQ